MIEAALSPLLQCPRCRRAPLVAAATGLACRGCDRRYPAVGGIPWLHADPDATLAEWRNRFAAYLAEFEREARHARAEAADPGLPAAARERVAALGAGYADQAVRVRELLAPLALAADAALSQATREATGVAVPLGQDLHSYYANLHRDWAWGDQENVAAAELVGNWVSPAAARVLVLGAGASRLAYDLHAAASRPLTVALDINPLLLLAAARLARGEALSLYEFPLAPLRATDGAVLRRLAAPAPARPGLEFVFADAWRAPFAPQSFDVVVTPWLVDVVDLDFASIALHVNRLVAAGGRWINFGSLAFPWRRAAWRHGPEETLALVAGAGFETRDVRDVALPYMRSPASRHARVETVFAFAADKVSRAPRAPEPPQPPDWLRDTSRPVPRFGAVDLAGTSARIQAVLLALVDGTRSVDAIAAIVAEQGLLPAPEARRAVAGLLEGLHAAERRGRPRVN
ncbi:MAG: hypothetical protein O9284_06240 [Steroidobacteraceae bacterium]|jgi:uncharacterized protein YbaR (Trm112 family)|nr:hypothetical protein [Steroidobacteraceae bacterium]